MGLRFRKTVKICDGLKLNFGLKGASLTVGGGGLQKTFHTSGRTTTTIGLPGSGVYWTETTGRHAEEDSSPRLKRPRCSNPQPVAEQSQEKCREAADFAPDLVSNPSPSLLDSLKDVLALCDEPVEWTEILAGATAEELDMDSRTCAYYKERAKAVISGNVDAYLDVIDYARPVDDLLLYAGEFEFGTDRADCMEVEFTVLESMQDETVENLARVVAVRVARDTMALLPVSEVRVMVSWRERELLDVSFSKSLLSEINFNVAGVEDVYSALGQKAAG